MGSGRGQEQEAAAGWSDPEGQGFGDSTACISVYILAASYLPWISQGV